MPTTYWTPWLGTWRQAKCVDSSCVVISWTRVLSCSPAAIAELKVLEVQWPGRKNQSKQGVDGRESEVVQPERLLFFFFLKKLNVFFLCICVGVHTLPCACGGQRTSCENWFSPSTVGLPGSELRPLGLAITHKAFSPFTPVLIFQVMMLSFPSVIVFIFQYRFFFYQLLSLYEGKYWHMAGFMFLCLYACWEELRCVFLTGKYKVWCFWEVGKRKSNVKHFPLRSLRDRGAVGFCFCGEKAKTSD